MPGPHELTSCWKRQEKWKDHQHCCSDTGETLSLTHYLDWFGQCPVSSDSAELL